MAPVLRAPRALLLAVATLGMLLMAPAAHAVDTQHRVDLGGPAGCLRATGADGRVALVGTRSKGAFTTDLRAVSPDGDAQPDGGVLLGTLEECQTTASAGGHLVVAGTVDAAGTRSNVVAALRDPQGAWSPPVVLAHADGERLVAAMSPRGDAAVAWIEQCVCQDHGDRARYRVRIAIRPAGGAFGRPRTLSPWTIGESGQAMALAAAYDADGALTVAWTRPRPGQRVGRGTAGDLTDVQAALAPPGAPLGAPQRLAHDEQEVTRIALAVGAGGRALLAFPGSSRGHVFERPADGQAFVRRDGFVPAHGDASPLIDDIALALGPDGSAVVAWRQDRSLGEDAPRRDEVVLRRIDAAGTAAAAPLLVVSEPVPRDGLDYASAFVSSDGGLPTEDTNNYRLQVALGADGGVALVWTTDTRAGDLRAHAASVASDGTVAHRVISNPCRVLSGVAAIVVDGVAVVLFTDNNVSLMTVAPKQLRGALHHVSRGAIASPGAPSPAPIARVELAPRRALRYGEHLPVRVVCDRECDVRVRGPAPFGVSSFAPLTGARLAAGVATRLSLEAFGGSSLVSRRRHGVPLRITACAPDGTSSFASTALQPATQIPGRRGPRVRDVRAQRVGRTIVVTWTVPRAMPRVSFVVFAEGGDALDPGAVTTVRGAGRTRFRVVLHPEAARRITKVTVRGMTDEPPFSGSAQEVRLR